MNSHCAYAIQSKGQMLIVCTACIQILVAKTNRISNLWAVLTNQQELDEYCQCPSAITRCQMCEYIIFPPENMTTIKERLETAECTVAMLIGVLERIYRMTDKNQCGAALKQSDVSALWGKMCDIKCLAGSTIQQATDLSDSDEETCQCRCDGSNCSGDCDMD